MYCQHILFWILGLFYVSLISYYFSYKFMEEINSSFNRIDKLLIKLSVLKTIKR